MSTVTGKQLAAHFCDLLTVALGTDGLATTLSRIPLPDYEGREPFDGLADGPALLAEAYADLGGDPLSLYNQTDLWTEALYRSRVARYDPARL